jgi:hypothetical protein
MMMSYFVRATMSAVRGMEYVMKLTEMLMVEGVEGSPLALRDQPRPADS